MRLLLLLLAPLALWAGPGEALRDRASQEALAFAEAQAAQGGGRSSIRLLRPPVLPRLREGEVAFEPSHLSKAEPTGVFFALLRVLVDGKPAGMVRVDLEGRWQGTILKARTALPRKAVPCADQFEAVPFEGAPPPGALSEIPDGFRLREPLAIGKVLTRASLEPIPLVSTGDRVRVTIAWEALSIAGEATARSSGALGDRIRVELPTRKQLQAVVTGRGEAHLAWAR